NVGRLRQLLDETRDSPDRGFEWYYWQRQIHSAALMTLQTGGHPSGGRFFPGGQRVLGVFWQKPTPLGGGGGRGRGNFRFQPEGSFTEPVIFSPDGTRIAFGNSEGTVTVFDASSRQKILSLKGTLLPSSGSTFPKTDGGSPPPVKMRPL